VPRRFLLPAVAVVAVLLLLTWTLQPAYPVAVLTEAGPAELPPRMELPLPQDPICGEITISVSEGGRARLLVQGRWVANIGRGQTTVPVREGNLIEVDARASAVLIVDSAVLSDQLVLMPGLLPVDAGRRLVTLGWVRGPSWPGACQSGR
jgi:hypothetical protein